MKKHFKLPKNFLKAWIKALESGNYDQGRCQLRGDNNKYCCLGVAVAITPGGDRYLNESGRESFIENYEGVPEELRGEYKFTEILANLNDGFTKNWRDEMMSKFNLTFKNQKLDDVGDSYSFSDIAEFLKRNVEPY